MSKYIHFTEEQKEQARRTDIVSLLKSRGEKLKRSGSEYEWKTDEGKITIRGNVWFHQYEREGGDAIDFVRRFYNMDFPETVTFLLAENGIVVEPPEEKEKEKKEFALPKANYNMKRVYGYLLKGRYLDREVVDYFVLKQLLYEDEQYHNAVFVGRDENGKACHAHKRGTLTESSFKGNVDGSNPDYSFHYIGHGNKLYVFEAPVDMLSFISIFKDNWKENSYVALCSVAPQAALYILRNNPQIEEVYTCLDHDKAGIEGNYRIAEAVRSMGNYKIKQGLPPYKDWNECLKCEHGIEPLPASEHEGLERMKELCAELVEECQEERKIPSVEELQMQFQNIKKLEPTKYGRIAEQSFELSKVAFLFAKKQFTAMEKGYSDEQYIRILFGFYAPHHDNCGLKSRVNGIAERIQELVKDYGKDKILTESELMRSIENIFSLSVDSLRLHMFAQFNQLKQEEGEVLCQGLQL